MALPFTAVFDFAVDAGVVADFDFETDTGLAMDFGFAVDAGLATDFDLAADPGFAVDDLGFGFAADFLISPVLFTVLSLEFL